MRKEWIMDVLADLKAFADHNGLDATAAGLDDAMLVAVAELAALDHRRAPARGPAAAAGGNVTELFAHRARV